MKRIALRKSPCGLPNVVVGKCPFVKLFLTCSVISFMHNV